MIKALTMLQNPPQRNAAWVRDHQATIFAAAQGLTPSELMETINDLVEEMEKETTNHRDFFAIKVHLVKAADLLEAHLHAKRLAESN